jgi:multidrug transporter EmrE-like cation transporter
LWALSNIFFKVGAEQFQGLIHPSQFLSVKFLLTYIFTPFILIALILAFASKILIGTPMSMLGAGRLIAIVTTISVIFTAILSGTLLGEKFDLMAILGIIACVIGIVLIGQGV